MWTIHSTHLLVTHSALKKQNDQRKHKPQNQQNNDFCKILLTHQLVIHSALKQAEMWWNEQDMMISAKKLTILWTHLLVIQSALKQAKGPWQRQKTKRTTNDMQFQLKSEQFYELTR